MLMYHLVKQKQSELHILSISFQTKEKKMKIYDQVHSFGHKLY